MNHRHLLEKARAGEVVVINTHFLTEAPQAVEKNNKEAAVKPIQIRKSKIWLKQQIFNEVNKDQSYK